MFLSLQLSDLLISLNPELAQIHGITFKGLSVLVMSNFLLHSCAKAILYKPKSFKKLLTTC
jgi:hypothetical protein